jgi:hypothetical protein
MSHRKDYVPSNKDEFNLWQKNLMQKLDDITLHDKWNIPQPAYLHIQSLRGTWESAYEATALPHNCTPVLIAVRNDARMRYESELRKFIKAYLTFNPMVLDSDRIAMSLPVHKKTRTNSPVAGKYPDHTLDPSVLRRITINFFDSEHGTRKGKPEGQYCAEVGWIISDVRPTKLKELVNSTIDTSSPVTLEFDEDQRGKSVYFALRWENTRGKKGPWSPIFRAIVP